MSTLRLSLFDTADCMLDVLRHVLREAGQPTPVDAVAKVYGEDMTEAAITLLVAGGHACREEDDLTGGYLHLIPVDRVLAAWGFRF